MLCILGASPAISWDARRKGNDPFLVQDYLSNPMTWTDPKSFKPLEQISQVSHPNTFFLVRDQHFYVRSREDLSQ